MVYLQSDIMVNTIFNILPASSSIVMSQSPTGMGRDIFVMENQEEIWKVIDGYDGCYWVSNLGRVKSTGKTCNPYFGSKLIIRPDCFLKPSITNWGYCRVVLQYYGARKHIRVHRLIAEYFIPNPHNKPQVNHIDGNKLNNKASNLEWSTDKENHAHAEKYGLKKRDIYNQNFIKTKTVL